MTLLDIAASGAAQRAEFGLIPSHREFLLKRKILNAAQSIGGRTITGRHGRPILYLPYKSKAGKSYEVGSDSPWLQLKPENTYLPLFNGRNVDFSRTWILTEGEWDALSAIEVGFDNACSLPDGAVQPKEELPAQSGKLRAIREAWPDIQAGGGSVILALDNDQPGEVTKKTLIEIFGRWRCLEIDWPKHKDATGEGGKCKDLNEILCLCGGKELIYRIQQAKPLKLEGVFQANEIPKRQPRIYYPIGIPEMDQHIKLFRGELCVLTGHTSHGKSNVLLGILGHLAQSGLKIGLAAFEAEYWEDILPWYNNWLYGESANDETETQTHEWLNKNFVFINHEIEPLQTPATIEWLIQQAQDAKGRFSIDVLAIDPWNKLQHKRKMGETETDYVGRALSEFRNFARVYNVIGIISAHPDKESGKDGKVPTEYDTHGGAHWANAPDHVLTVFRPDKTLTTTLLNVAKCRVRKAGKPGQKWFVFSTDTNKYSLLAEHRIPKLEEPPKRRKKY